MRYVLGLDIGITSVGWAILGLNEEDNPYKIIDLGSRIFPKAETDDGGSLAAKRREYRGARRRLRRLRHRLDRLIHLFSRNGMGTNSDIIKVISSSTDTDIFAIRSQGLDRLLSDEEWMRSLYHFAKHRGFKSNRKNADSGSEEGQVLEAVRKNNEILSKYRTVGEMLSKDKKFADKKHNSKGSYITTVSRDMLLEEIKTLFKQQRIFGNKYTAKEFEEEYIKIFTSQRSFAEGPGGNSPYGGDQIAKMIGICTLERQNGEKRACKASYAFMKFTLLQKINNIVLQSGSGERKLNDEERKIIADLAWGSPSVTYYKIRQKLEISFDTLFKGLYYEDVKEGESIEDSIIASEKKSKFNLVAPYHEMRKALDGVSKNHIKELSPQQIDDIAYAFTVYRTDEKLEAYLKENGISEEDIAILLSKLKSFSKFGHISLKACYKLIPFLEKGYTYDKACEAAGYDFHGMRGEKTVLLSSKCDEINEIPNPVVKRAVIQTIKVINAIVRKYGSPVEVHVELAREMGKTKKERDKLNKSMKENQARNERIKEELKNTYKLIQPTGQQILMLRLLKEQNFHCAYSLKPLNPELVFSDRNYAQIDHIIPYSRSFDDSYSNKVIVLTAENQNKGNNIPMKYLDYDLEHKHKFTEWVKSSIRDKRKRHNLLLEEYTEQMAKDWKERNLNDTKYISSMVYNFLNSHLMLAEGKRKKRIISVNGIITSYVRKRNGINKIRENGDLHHAVDAVVIASVTQGVIQKITNYIKWKEIVFSRGKKDNIIDYETGEIITKESFDEHLHDVFPVPWDKFREEIDARVSKNPQENIRGLRLGSYTKDEIEELKPIFVSRMPRRSAKGAAHEATVMRKGDEEGIVIKKVPLDKLSLSDDGKEIVDYYNPSSDRLLYNKILERLNEYRDENGKVDAKKAFAEPLYKPKADGGDGPVVKKVKIVEKSNLNVSLDKKGGVAKNGDMIRIDMFYIPDGKDKGYYFVPIYVADTVKSELPNKAVVAAKPYDKWKVMDDKDFIFSLYPNDLVYIENQKKIKLSLVNRKDDCGNAVDIYVEKAYLYYKKAGIANGAITIENHDGTYIQPSLGCKTLNCMKKAVVDVLGNISLVEKEKRMPLHR